MSKVHPDYTGIVGEQYSHEGPVCPYCGHLDKDDTYDGEGFHEYTCGSCDNDYTCSIYVRLSYTTNTVTP